MRIIFSLFFFIAFSFLANAQQEDKNKLEKESKVSSLKKVEKAIKDNNPAETAVQYTNLGNQYAAAKKYSLSNTYYQRALTIYKDLKDNNKQAEILRKIAINNEALQNFTTASSYYSQAENKATNKSDRQLNYNDLNRVRNNSNPEKQADFLNDNIKILEETNKKEEVAQTYEQRATLSLANKDTLAAISDLKKVVKTSENNNVKLEATTKLASIYAAADSLKTAIKILEESSKKAYQTKDWENYFTLQQKLANYYFKENNTENALFCLENSLKTAYEISNTKWVTTLNNNLYNYYFKIGNTAKANEYAQVFMQRAWNLVNTDSLLVQNKLVDEISQRVSLLEKEKETQTILYQKSKKFNNVLLVLLISLSLAVLAIVLTLKRLKKKNLQVQLQSLRREMNPHFVFNSLNSVNQFIALNDEIAANNYLTKYATLMRNVMNASNKDFVTLQEEKEALQHYISLEHLRFENQFEYQLIIDDSLDTNQTNVPNMLLQPFIENAIWHGLRYKKEKGLLIVSIKKNENRVEVHIQDNGIGIEASKAIKTKHQQTYKSRGIKNTIERIETLNKLYNCDIIYTTQVLNSNDNSGTSVIVSWKNNKL